MGRALFGYTVVNLGCKVNRVEADGFERLLAERGGVPVGEAAADLIVVNTCTVTGEAEKKTRKAVRHALSTNDGARVVVTGCASELSSETFAAMGDRVVVVPKAGADLYLSELEMSGAAPCETSESFSASPADGRTRIGIKVQDGCDNACTYCIVHVARGRATSRPAGEVVAEAVALAESGVREVVLTGINLGSYDDGGTDLTDLCRRLLTATADLYGAGEPPCRFRIGSIEPMDVTGEFVSLLAEAEGRICRHLHLPLQSGSSRVLREMARPYDAHEFRQLADFLRASVPSIALTTDIIVGFPGETDELATSASRRSTCFPTPSERERPRPPVQTKCRPRRRPPAPPACARFPTSSPPPTVPLASAPSSWPSWKPPRRPPPRATTKCLPPQMRRSALSSP